MEEKIIKKMLNMLNYDNVNINRNKQTLTINIDNKIEFTTDNSKNIVEMCIDICVNILKTLNDRKFNKNIYKNTVRLMDRLITIIEKKESIENLINEQMYVSFDCKYIQIAPCNINTNIIEKYQIDKKLRNKINELFKNNTFMRINNPNIYHYTLIEPINYSLTNHYVDNLYDVYNVKYLNYYNKRSSFIHCDNPEYKSTTHFSLLNSLKDEDGKIKMHFETKALMETAYIYKFYETNIENLKNMLNEISNQPLINIDDEIEQNIKTLIYNFNNEYYLSNKTLRKISCENIVKQFKDIENEWGTNNTNLQHIVNELTIAYNNAMNYIKNIYNTFNEEYNLKFIFSIENLDDRFTKKENINRKLNELSNEAHLANSFFSITTMFKHKDTKREFTERILFNIDDNDEMNACESEFDYPKTYKGEHKQPDSYVIVSDSFSTEFDHKTDAIIYSMLHEFLNIN